MEKHNELDISVLIATHNRAEILRQTLENMTKLDVDGLKVEFVVIDNNSSDNTAQVIDSFKCKLPLKHLFEPRPGKNCALNKALNEVPLGQIVVFTDDDVEPESNWLRTIKSVTDRWPDQMIFGGKIHVISPIKDAPAWLGDPTLPMCNLGAHEPLANEGIYPKDSRPNGANYWVRRDVFKEVPHFNEKVGPSPVNRIMGSEFSFLLELSKKGFKFIYCPEAIVGHCVTKAQINPAAIRKRAWRCGRQGPSINGLCRQELLSHHPLCWYAIRCLATVRQAFKFLLSNLHFSADKRLIRSITPVISIAYNVESLKLAKRKRSS